MPKFNDFEHAHVDRGAPHRFRADEVLLTEKFMKSRKKQVDNAGVENVVIH